jgi:hypothetical protein
VPAEASGAAHPRPVLRLARAVVCTQEPRAVRTVPSAAAVTAVDAWRSQVIFGALIFVLWLCKLYEDYSTRSIEIRVRR